MEKQRLTSVSVISAESDEEIDPSNFTWLDQKTFVAFVLSQEVTRDGLPIVLSSRPKENIDPDEFPLSPENTLQFLHCPISTVNDRLFGVVSHNPIDILDPYGNTLAVRVVLRIKDVFENVDYQTPEQPIDLLDAA